jgi:ferric-dicitrate binding protein FerR (iron transport regulator)
MTTRDCERWRAICDAGVLGEEVSLAEHEFELQHQASCPHCRAEASLWASLKPNRLHVLPSADEVDEVLRLVPLGPLGTRPDPSVRPTVRRVAFAATGAALAMAAGFFLWVKTQAAPVAVLTPLPPPLAAVGERPRSESLAREATPSVQPAPASTPERFTEDTCRDVVSGITLCVAAGSEIASMDLASPRRIVHLTKGRAIASLVPQPQGTSFSIATKDGSVTAVGTKFTVEVGSNGETLARVHHGKVVVRAPGLVGETFLVAGQGVKMGSEEVAPVSERERARDLRLLSKSVPGKSGESAALARPGVAPRRGDLERARELRLQGRFKEAAQVYSALHAASPSSASGRAALVSLGSLSLSALGDPQGALNAFSRYLSGGGGPLSKEAEYGRLRALRALGRNTEADRATEAYLLRYPSSPESNTLRRSLRAEPPE